MSDNLTEPATATIPEHLRKRLEEEEAKGSLTKEEMDAKQAAAEERRQKLEADRIQKVRDELEHAREVAERLKSETAEKDAQLEALRTKLQDAEKRKEDIERQRLEKIEQHHQQVHKFKATEEELEERSKEIEEKLAAAEARRKVIEEEKIRKAHVDRRKSDNADELYDLLLICLGLAFIYVLTFLPLKLASRKSLDKEKMRKIEERLQKVELAEKPGPSVTKEDVDAKLAAAEARRKEVEQGKLEKLAEKDKYAEEVRKRAENTSQEAEAEKAPAV
ncbi:hypothetical protein BC937DRAFT_89452 [Endogone sp. FLAS-F59071]|nr:hypothetical protein BC937DRAFT_89452 [Endogone sp. FLAS-F59071]|eukprot:RUS17820.1 hypothetical protein BC937DRAFT_89452 [Endogone sp. FLAS-F59071]